MNQPSLFEPKAVRGRPQKRTQPAVEASLNALREQGRIMLEHEGAAHNAVRVANALDAAETAADVRMLSDTLAKRLTELGGMPSAGGGDLFAELERRAAQHT